MRKLLTLMMAAAIPTGTALYAQGQLPPPQFGPDGALKFPDDADEWVHVGTTLGGDYNETPFDPAQPGTFGVVQMEPSAYRDFLATGEYPDGTMFLLTFYRGEARSEPQLQGFVQGEMTSREIHIIDPARYPEGSAFFVFASADVSAGTRMPEGSRCIQCHTAEGDYRATFIQFYPALRDLPRR